MCWEAALNQLWSRNLKSLQPLCLSFKRCISEKINVPDGSCCRQGEESQKNSGQAAQPTATWNHPSPIHKAVCSRPFFLPLLPSIFKTSWEIGGKHNSSDIVLAVALWMMSIILQQMTAIHLRAAPSSLTRPYLADPALSNANLSLFPPGTEIPSWTAAVYQIGWQRDIPQERIMNM